MSTVRQRKNLEQVIKQLEKQGILYDGIRFLEKSGKKHKAV